MTGVAALPLAIGAGQFPIPVDIGLCYKLSSAANPSNFSGGSYVTSTVDEFYRSLAANGSISGLAAGDYTAGACIRNSSSVAINRSDWVNGWVMVHN
jgi:hypothetical protein